MVIIFFSHQYFNECLHVGSMLETKSESNCRSRLKRRLMRMQLAVSGKMVSLWQWVSVLARTTWKSPEAGVLRLSRQSNRQPSLPPMLSSLKEVLVLQQVHCELQPTAWPLTSVWLATVFVQCRNFDQSCAAHHLVQRACPTSTGES